MIRAFERFSGRKLTVNGILWKWKTGKGGNIVAMSEAGRRIQSFANQVTGRDFERGQRKKTQDGMITPKDVAEWIKKNRVKCDKMGCRHGKFDYPSSEGLCNKCHGTGFL